MAGGGNGQKERSTMKTSVSLFEKHEIMCYDPVFFCPIFEVKLELQNAPDCTDLHLEYLG